MDVVRVLRVAICRRICDPRVSSFTNFFVITECGMAGCCPLNTPLVNDIVSGLTTRNRQPASLRSSDLSLLTFTANKVITRLSNPR